MRVLWELEGPSTALRDVLIQSLGGRRCDLRFDIPDGVGVRLTFSGIEQARWSTPGVYSLELIDAAYGRVVDMGESSWLSEVRALGAEYWEAMGEHPELRHLAVLFDESFAFEAICTEFSCVDDPGVDFNQFL